MVGTSTPPKYLGVARSTVAFPARAVTADRPVTVKATATAREAFPGDCLVDLSVDAVHGAQAFLIRGISVAGQFAAPLIWLRLEGDAIVVRPVEGGSATLGLGGWCAKRREELGKPLTPTMTELIIDASASMRRNQRRVEAVQTFVKDLYATTGTPAPLVRTMGVGDNGAGVAAGPGGVGAVRIEPGMRGRRVLLTDLPAASGQAECLVIGTPTLTKALDTARGAEYIVLDDSVWQEILREDNAFDDRTLSALAPLLDWLSPSAASSTSSATIGIPS